MHCYTNKIETKVCWKAEYKVHEKYEADNKTP